MGIYAENISRLSFKELLENLENIERAIVETKLRIKKVERKIEKIFWMQRMVALVFQVSMKRLLSGRASIM